MPLPFLLLPLLLPLCLPLVLLLIPAVTAQQPAPPQPQPLPVVWPPSWLPAGVQLTNHSSGLLDISTIAGLPTNQSALLFYYFVPSSLSPSLSDPSIPLFLWLQGGPGCTSMVGLFAEHGPLLLTPPASPTSSPPFTLTANPSSWSASFHLLYIDQPIATGFSPPPPSPPTPTTLPIPSNETSLTSTLYLSLLSFYSLFPSLTLNPLHLSGESYAGKYVPTLATLTLLQNAAINSSSPPFTSPTLTLSDFPLPRLPYSLVLPLAGLALGNALIDPAVQRFAFRQIGLSTSLLSSFQAASLTALERRCSHALSTLNYTAANLTCPRLLNYVTYTSAGVNLYDQRRWDDSFSRPLLAAFMDSPDARKALNVPDIANRSYADDCSADVAAAMALDVYHSTAVLLPALFARLPVLLYNGDFDIKDGSRGTEELVTSLPGWPDRFAFLQQPRFPFYSTSTPFPPPPSTAPDGFSQSYGNVTTVVVTRAGHFSPRDQPQAVLSMLQRWVKGTPLCAMVGGDGRCVVNGTAGCELRGRCGADEKRGQCQDDRCVCGLAPSGVQWGGAMCEVATTNVTGEGAPQPVKLTLEPQQSALYHLYVNDVSQLPLHLYANAYSSQQDAVMLLDLSYLAQSPSLSPSFALTLLSQFDPSNRYFHYHHPALSPASAVTHPTLLSSSRNAAQEAWAVTVATSVGYYAVMLTNLHSATADFTLTIDMSANPPSLSFTSLALPFNSAAVGLLATLLGLVAASILILVAVRKCAGYRRKVPLLLASHPA